MDPERWRRLEKLYHSAMEQKPGERARFLSEACAGDEKLHREVKLLLEHARDVLVDQPVWEMRTEYLHTIGGESAPPGGVTTTQSSTFGR